MFSVCSHLGGIPRPGPDGGYPSQVRWGGVPHLGYPLSDLARGYPSGEVPQGVGTPVGGYPTSDTPPPSDLAGGGIPVEGTPPQVPPVRPGRGGGYPTSYRITDGVLDTPWSVCLLRSRRRTFLFFKSFSEALSQLAALHNC